MQRRRLSSSLNASGRPNSALSRDGSGLRAFRLYAPVSYIPCAAFRGLLRGLEARSNQLRVNRTEVQSSPTVVSMTEHTSELQAINTAWQIAIQEVLRMVIRDMYHGGGEAAFMRYIKRIEEAAVESIYTDLRLRGTDELDGGACERKGQQFRYDLAHIVHV